jgi:hypothetical protein
LDDLPASVQGVINLLNPVHEDFMLNGMLSAIGNWFADVGTWFVDLANWSNTIFNRIGTVANYLNPVHKDFFLWVALIPSEGYFEAKTQLLYDTLDGRFAFIGQINDAMKEVTKAISSGKWPGVKATIPIIEREMVIVDPIFVNSASAKLKAWIGGLIVMILFGYLVRKGSKLLGEGR